MIHVFIDIKNLDKYVGWILKELYIFFNSVNQQKIALYYKVAILSTTLWSC